MKIVVTGTRGIPNIMGGVETHCEELFPRMVERGYDVTDHSAQTVPLVSLK